MKTLTQILEDIKTRACEASNYNENPTTEMPLLVDDKFTFEAIIQLVVCLEETIGILFKYAHIEDNESVNTDLNRVLAILQGDK